MKKYIYFLILLFIVPTTTIVAQAEIDLAKRELQTTEIAQNADFQKLSQRDIDEMSISSAYKSPSTGWFHIYFNQKYRNIEVYNALLNVLLVKNKVANVVNQFVPKIEQFVADETINITPEKAVLLAAQHLEINPNKLEIVSTERLPNNTIFKAIFTDKNISKQNITVQLYWLPNVENRELRLVWNVNIEMLDKQNWWNIRLDAKSGAIIEQNNWVAHCAFDAPSQTCEHQHKTDKITVKTAEKTPLIFAPNTYNVFDIPLESPNHGARTSVVSPYTRFVPSGTGPGATNGWHSNATTAFTNTRGNNVSALEDTDGNNSTSGASPNSATLDFDYPYNFGVNTANGNQNAAITNLFYWSNLIHDVLYRYGFDEPSGNFQEGNMGRGGAGNDYVFADAQDGSGLNNANFSTPVDGTNGRMQMYLWDNGTVTFNVSAPTAIAGNYAVIESAVSINNKITSNITANLVLVDDAGTATTALGCTANLPYDNAAALAGKIAVIDRGTCNFGEKILNAQNAGAVAVIVINNVTTAIIAMTGSDNTITIPAFMISQANGNTIRAQLNAGQTVVGNFTLSGYQPDGDFDNGVIAHEYGHGWSTRLTGGPANSSCLANTEQGGEGWGDYLALMTCTNWSSLSPTLASANISRGIGTYVSKQPITGNGIRPFPYSYNKAVVNNSVTYSQVGNTSYSIPHGIGSIWATMLWDMTWEIIMQDGVIVSDISNTSNLVGNAAALKLVNEGLRLQPCSPSFVAARNAILQADALLFNKKYYCSIWKAFARRGLGVNASTGTSSNDRVVTQDFTEPTNTFTLKKQASPTTASAGNAVTYTLTATCGCQSTTTTVSDPLPSSLAYVSGSASGGGSFSGNTVTWSGQNFTPIEAKTYTFQATVNAGTGGPTSTMISDDFDGSTPSGSWVTAATIGATNFANTSVFTRSGATAKIAPNIVGDCDFSLTTGVNYSITGPATFSFWHRWNTEAGWDGGVVEISNDNGVTWKDGSTYFVSGAYNGSLSSFSRQGFTGLNATWTQSSLNLGAFCGQNVKIRFRMLNDLNADCGTANCGWFIDDVTLSIPTGINNVASVSGGSTANACIQVAQALPIELLSFTATAATDKIRLDWTTAMEQNNKHFEIWRSDDDGNDYQKINEVRAKNTPYHYTYDDVNILTEKNYYYYLFQKDNDGRGEKTKIVNAFINAKTKPIKVYPNPTSGIVTFKSLQTFDDDITLILKNIDGRILTKTTINTNQLQQGFEWNIGSDYGKGIFFIDISADGFLQTKKIVVTE